ncbi:hypothetical protein [Flavobacterium ustbae]|uniref:hypothetical protein n=1 Tax=Flavobacterium ustbae TaxID=2488790 RepID=UPI000F7A423A|nr:hypothetical protein [Flavobacterium ustbae]
MEAIRLEFQPEIKEKILKLLSEFSSEELRIVEDDFEDSDFERNKEILRERAVKIDNKTAQYSTFEELDMLLEDTIKKYED